MRDLPQVRLRALEMSDLDLLYEVENDAQFSECSTNLMPLSRGAMKRFIQQSLTLDLFALRQLRFVIEKCPATPVGFIDLVEFSPEHRRAEVGVAVLAQYRKQGLGTAALQQLCDWASRQLSVVQLYAYVQSENIASQRLFQKVGFRQTAVLPSWFVKGGVLQDAHVYQCVFELNQLEKRLF